MKVVFSDPEHVSSGYTVLAYVYTESKELIGTLSDDKIRATGVVPTKFLIST